MKIYINTDENKEIAVKTRDKVIKTCKELSFTVTDNPLNADIICSIGGDGTFLESSRLSINSPVIGINCGTLGYLTDINPDEITKALNDIKDKKYYIEERMMLEGEVIKEDGEIIKISPALNDIVIAKNTFGVVRFDTIIDGKLINSYTADGIIICTPTGSTAYNLSCGGPIADPNAHIITLTPIAPHSILNKSIILSDESIVEITINELRQDSNSYALYNGIPIEIATGDKVRIYKSKQITKIMKLNWQSFIDNVRKNIK